MIVVSDTTPLLYLVQVEESHLLPALYGRVLIPPAVVAELGHPGAPNSIRSWISAPRQWLEVKEVERTSSDFPEFLDPGEREAIALSQQLGAELLLIDEWDGRDEATRRFLNIAGTLRVLASAAEQGLVEFRAAIARLRATNFRASEKLLQSFLSSDF